MTAHCILCGSERSDLLFHKDGYDLVRCADCNLAYVRNPPAPEQLASLYSADAGYHKELLTGGAQVDMFRAETVGKLAFVAAHARPGRILDIGCSAGFFLRACADKGWDTVGIELNPGTAQFARTTLGLDVINGTVDDAEFSDGSFDVITLWDVIEHLPDPVRCLQRVVRWLRPGGTLVMETPNIDGLFPRLSYHLAKPLDFWPHPEPPGHLFQFSVETFARLISNAGLNVIAVRHGRIPIAYWLGNWRVVLRSPKRIAYGALFAPVALLGPMISQGDTIRVAARRVS